jgi:hypothetical protein
MMMQTMMQAMMPMTMLVQRIMQVMMQAMMPMTMLVQAMGDGDVCETLK